MIPTIIPTIVFDFATVEYLLFYLDVICNLLCSCLRSRLTSLDILNFAHHIAKIKILSRVFLRVFPVKPRNTYIIVYFFRSITLRGRARTSGI